MFRKTKVIVDKQQRFREGDFWRHPKQTAKLKRAHRKAAKWASKYA